MRKKRKLTNFGKRLLIFIILIIAALIFKALLNKGYNDLKEQAKKCDLTKGYTCSLYEIRNFNE